MQSDLNNPKLEDQIDLYLSGSLSHEEIELLWEQLIEHPQYVDYMKTCAGLRKIGSEDKESESSSKTEETITSYNFRYAIAAGIVLLLTVIGVLNIYPESETYYPEPLAVLELNNLRSSDTFENDFEREIQHGISLAVLGQEEKALEVLHQLKAKVESEEQKLDVMVNIGIVHYNLADFDSAKSTFLAVTQNPHAEPLIKEKAWWYLANSYLKTNHREDAKVAAQHTYDVNGAYRRMAARWLERL